MREIVLDTETTGLDPEAGDRIVEIGAVELFNHLPTERRFHRYLNPERSMPPEAFAVHGLSDEFLSDKPRFSEVVDEFLHFVGEDARLVIHNAAFDMRFLNAELIRCGRRALPDARALDTLMLARQRFPGAQNSLDALCRRFGVDTTRRTLHGALLDSEILAEVYLELIGGRQPDLVLDRPSEAADGQMRAGMAQHRPLTRPAPLPPRLSAAERGAHDAFVTQMGDKAIWRRYLATAGAGG